MATSPSAARRRYAPCCVKAPIMRTQRPTHPLHPYFTRLCAQRGYKMAVVAVAHRLCRILFALLRDGTTSDVAQLAVEEGLFPRSRAPPCSATGSERRRHVTEVVTRPALPRQFGQSFDQRWREQHEVPTGSSPRPFGPRFGEHDPGRSSAGFWTKWLRRGIDTRPGP
jgi:hypothetical protein